METAFANAAPPPPRLPGLSIALAIRAGELAGHARPLLAASKTTLLSVTRTHGRSLMVRGWNARGRPVDLFCAIDDPAEALRGSLAALRAAGSLVLEELARRWPANAVPPSVGLVTDGTGVAFSPDHPSPLAPGWLALQLQGTTQVATLLAFAPGSSWSCLTAVVAPQRVH